MTVLVCRGATFSRKIDAKTVAVRTARRKISFVLFLYIDKEKTCHTVVLITLVTKNFGRQNFGRLIFGHVFPYFGQISDTDETLLSKFTPAKHELDWENVRKMIVLLHP